jgi:hypothetical protein
MKNFLEKFFWQIDFLKKYPTPWKMAKIFWKNYNSQLPPVIWYPVNGV